MQSDVFANKYCYLDRGACEKHKKGIYWYHRQDKLDGKEHARVFARQNPKYKDVHCVSALDKRWQKAFAVFFRGKIAIFVTSWIIPKYSFV